MILPCLVRAAPLLLGVLAGHALIACRAAPDATRPDEIAAERPAVDTEKALRTAKYYVVGRVEEPGAKDFTGDVTLLEAILRAKPVSDSGNLGRVRLIRADPRDAFIQTFDVSDLLTRGDSTFNVHVHERDIIYVPPTMLAEFGYFLDSLLFPVKFVLESLSSAIFSYNALQNGNYYGNYNNNNNGIF